MNRAALDSQHDPSRLPAHSTIPLTCEEERRFNIDGLVSSVQLAALRAAAASASSRSLGSTGLTTLTRTLPTSSSGNLL